MMNSGSLTSVGDPFYNVLFLSEIICNFARCRTDAEILLAIYEK